MVVAGSSLETPSRNKALMVRLAPYLVEALCELTRLAKDKAHAQTEISGLMFGNSEDGIATVEAIKTFKDSGPRSDLARRERMEKAFEAALALAHDDPDFSAHKLLGWFSLRGSGGLINSDVEFHNRHFKGEDDIALIVWREGDSQITAELYATKGGKLSVEDYRWSSVRLSTELRRVSQPVDLVMRVRMNDDLYVRTYASFDKQERREEWKKITAAAKRTVLALLPGRSNGSEEESVPIPAKPKAEPSDASFGKRSFDSRTLFRDSDPLPALREAKVKEASPKEVSPKEASVREASAKEANLTQAVAVGGTTAKPAPVVPHAPVRAALPPASPEISGLPMVIPRHKPQAAKGTPWLSAALVAILCSGVTFGVYALNGVGTGSSKLGQIMRVLFPGTDLELRADPSGDRLLLTWNRKNPVVASASSAVLTITDGTYHIDRKLDPMQVANGSVLYRPVTGDVTFQLKVFGTDQSIALSSLRVLDATGAQTIGDTKPVLDAANAAAAQKTLPPPPPEAVNPPTAKPDAPVTNHAAKQSVVAANKPSAQPIKEAERIPTPAPAAVQKTDAPKPQQQTVTPPQTVVQQRPAVPLPQAPVTGSTAINGWDANLPETKPAAPQQPQNEPPPDAKTVAFVGPKVLLQVTPSTRNLSANLISAVTRVEVEVRIDLTGHVSAVHLESPNVKPQLASAALAAARQWTFQPATLRGQRVESTHTIVFEFSPNGQ